MCDFPYTEYETVTKDHLPNESLYLIITLDPWYGDIIIYLQTQTFQSKIS